MDQKEKLKNVFIKAVFAGTLATGITFCYSAIQCFYQLVKFEDIYIEMGFPYEFYFFTPDFELHGGNILYFIYDSCLLFFLSFLIIHVGMKIKNKRRIKIENRIIDKTIHTN